MYYDTLSYSLFGGCLVNSENIESSLKYKFCMSSEPLL